jgi:hypothetical protein
VLVAGLPGDAEPTTRGATTHHALGPGMLTLLAAQAHLAHSYSRLAFDHNQTLRDTNWSGHHFGIVRFFLAARAWAARATRRSARRWAPFP